MFFLLSACLLSSALKRVVDTRQTGGMIYFSPRNQPILIIDAAATPGHAFTNTHMLRQLVAKVAAYLQDDL